MNDAMLRQAILEEFPPDSCTTARKLHRGEYTVAYLRSQYNQGVYTQDSSGRVKPGTTPDGFLRATRKR